MFQWGMMAEGSSRRGLVVAEGAGWGTRGSLATLSSGELASSFSAGMRRAGRAGRLLQGLPPPVPLRESPELGH